MWVKWLTIFVIVVSQIDALSPAQLDYQKQAKQRIQLDGFGDHPTLAPVEIPTTGAVESPTLPGEIINPGGK